MPDEEYLKELQTLKKMKFGQWANKAVLTHWQYRFARKVAKFVNHKRGHTNVNEISDSEDDKTNKPDPKRPRVYVRGISDQPGGAQNWGSSEWELPTMTLVDWASFELHGQDATQREFEEFIGLQAEDEAKPVQSAAKGKTKAKVSSIVCNTATIAQTALDIVKKFAKVTH